MLNIYRIVGTFVAPHLIKQQTQTRRGRKMRTDGQTIKGNEMDMGKVKAWVKRTVSGERVAVGIAKLVVAGYLGMVLAHVIHTY